MLTLFTYTASIEGRPGDDPCRRQACLVWCRWLLTAGGRRGLLSAWATEQYCHHTEWEQRTFQLAYSEQMYCANAFRTGRRNSSFPTICLRMRICHLPIWDYLLICGLYGLYQVGHITGIRTKCNECFNHLKHHSYRLLLRRTELPVQYIYTDLSLIKNCVTLNLLWRMSAVYSTILCS
jgi:hypothetical protein